jgi:hypothetical protein
MLPNEFKGSLVRWGVDIMKNMICLKCRMSKSSALSICQSRGVTPTSVSTDQGRMTASCFVVWAHFEKRFLGAIWA